MTEEKSINKNFSAKELNDYLAKRYECSLIQIAYWIATVLTDSYSYDAITRYGIKISDASKKLDGIQRDFMESMVGYFNRFDLWGQFKLLSPERKKRFVRERFEETFKTFKEWATEIRHLRLGLGSRKRRPRKKLANIVSALNMSPKDRLGIIEWFYSRLQKTTYRGDLYMRGNSWEKTKRLDRMVKRSEAHDKAQVEVSRKFFFPGKRLGSWTTFYHMFSIKEIDFRRNMIRIRRISKENPEQWLTEARFEDARMKVWDKHRAIRPSSKEIKPRLYFPTDER